jgi:O-antigen/teichoic acid export membrane protein
LLLPVVALIFLSALQVVGLATLQGQTRYRTSAALQALRAAMSVAAMALVALNARDLLNVMWAAVVAELLSLTIIRTILARSGQTLARPRLGTLIPMLTYGLPLAPASLLLITNQLLPRAVLAHSGPRGFELSGLFSVASVLISPINYLAGPLQFVLLPSAIRRRSSVEAPSRRLALRKVIMAFAFVSCILVAAGALAGRQLPHYYPRLTGFPSSMVTILLGLGAVLAGTARLASVEMCALNATASVLTAQVASTVTTCGLLLLTVPLCGLLGAATAVLAGSIALVAVIVYKWLRTSPPRTPGGNLPWRTADACET